MLSVIHWAAVLISMVVTAQVAEDSGMEQPIQADS